MMREIKFRTWDMKYKQMQFLEMTGERHVSDALIIKGNRLSRNQDLSDWMQYTGLKDKINIPVYEDDIVELKHEGRYIGRGRVIFYKGQFLIEGDQLSLAGDLSHYSGEVIGNIYENPELLKGEV